MADPSEVSTSGGYNVDFDERQMDSVSADKVELNRCTVQSVQAQKVRMEQSASLFVAAESVEANNSAAMVIIAKEVSGDVRPLVSLPGALIIAGAILFGIALFRKS